MAVVHKLPDFTHDLDGRSLSFDGNTALKSVKQPLAYSKAHIEEIIKCKTDWRYFAENYYYILSLDEGMIKVKLRDYQDQIIQNFIDNRFNIVLASRQCGKSTSYEIFVLWYILFNTNKNVAILANKADTSRGILRKIKLAFELLPHWLQQGVKTWNVSSIELENGCTVTASATSSSAIRSKAANVVILDEMGFVGNNVWDDFYSSVYPTISSSKESKIIIVSTPNGLNHFYQFWQDAVKKRSEFVPVRVDWWQVPGRDKKWQTETIRNIGERRFATEYGNDFASSSFTLIESKYITAMSYESAIDLEDLEAIKELKLPTKYLEYLKIYDKPIPGHVYSMSIDSAKVVEDSVGDSVAIQILDITSMPIIQVGTGLIRDGVSYLEVPEIAVELGKWYNEAYMFVENNEIGQEVANMIVDFEYENIYWEKPSLPGYRTTKKTKRIGCSNLKMLAENEGIIIKDFETISEISTFIKNKASYAAEKGHHDDAVMALIGALFFMTDKDYVNIASADFLKGIMTRSGEAVQEADTSSFGIFDNGIEEKEELDWSWLYD